MIVIPLVLLFLLGLIIIAGVCVTLRLKKSKTDAAHSDSCAPDHNPIYETLEESIELAEPQARSSHPQPPDVMMNNTAYNLVPLCNDETAASSPKTTAADSMTMNSAYNLLSSSEDTPFMNDNCAYKPSRKTPDINVMTHNYAYNVLSSAADSDEDGMTKNSAYNLLSPSDTAPSMNNKFAYKLSRNTSDVMTNNCAYNALDPDEDDMTRNSAYNLLSS